MLECGLFSHFSRIYGLPCLLIVLFQWNRNFGQILCFCSMTVAGLGYGRTGVQRCAKRTVCRLDSFLKQPPRPIPHHTPRHRNAETEIPGGLLGRNLPRRSSNPPRAAPRHTPARAAPRHSPPRQKGHTPCNSCRFTIENTGGRNHQKYSPLC